MGECKETKELRKKRYSLFLEKIEETFQEKISTQKP